MANFTYDARRGGVFCPEQKLMPQPGRIFRRQALLDIVNVVYTTQASRQAQPLKGLKYLEIGCGTGIFAYEFYKLGAEVIVHDISTDVLEIASNIFNTDKERLKIKHDLDNEDKGLYDIVTAYSVLEHIEDDLAMLKYWKSFLKDNGTFILSVPARMKHWTYVDDVAGHLRRYEKNDLEKLLLSAGFSTHEIISLGVPFQLIIMKLAGFLVWKKEARALKDLSNQQKTELSGIVPKLYKYHRFLPYRLLVLMAKFQRLFYKTDWGFDFVVTAKRSIK